MKKVSLAVAAGALLLVSGCSSEPHTTPDAALVVQQGGVAPADTAPSGLASAPSAANTERRALGNGLYLIVSAPKSFTPTDTAYPRSPRAVAFDLTIDNQSRSAYRASQLVVVATVNGTATQQVIDSTQGYTGVRDGSDYVQPGDRMGFTVAFAVPDQKVAVVVTVQPDAAESRAVQVYDGIA